MASAPVTTAVILGETGDVRRFPSKAHFASYTGTAPIDASSGDNIRHRLNRGGNRRLNFALRVCALVQMTRPGPGRDYYLRKIAAGKTPLEAMRCLKRRLSDVVFRALLDDLNIKHAKAGPGGHSGATLQSSASGPTPAASPSNKSLPGPANNDATPAPKSLSAPVDREEPLPSQTPAGWEIAIPSEHDLCRKGPFVSALKVFQASGLLLALLGVVSIIVGDRSTVALLLGAVQVLAGLAMAVVGRVQDSKRRQ